MPKPTAAYSRLRASGVRAVLALWPYRHQSEAVRSAIKTVIFDVGQARYGR